MMLPNDCNRNKLSRQYSRKQLAKDDSVPILHQFYRQDSRVEYFMPNQFSNQQQIRLPQCRGNKSKQTFMNKLETHRNMQFQAQYYQLANDVRIEQLESRYQCIEKALNQENMNLKCQKQYLSNEIRKLYKREKVYKDHLKAAQQSASELSQENEIIKAALFEIRNFILNIVTHIQSVIREKDDHEVLAHSKMLFQQLKDFVSEDDVNSRITEKPDYITGNNTNEGFFSRLEQQNKITLVSQDQLQLQSKKNEPTADKQLGELNDRFQALMYEYKTSNNPQLRKKCIQIAKQMKNIKLTSAKQMLTKQSIDQAQDSIPTSKDRVFLSKQQIQREKKIKKKSQKEDLVNMSTERISRKHISKKILNSSIDQFQESPNLKSYISIQKGDPIQLRKGKK